MNLPPNGLEIFPIIAILREKNCKGTVSKVLGAAFHCNDVNRAGDQDTQFEIRHVVQRCAEEVGAALNNIIN